RRGRPWVSWIKGRVPGLEKRPSPPTPIINLISDTFHTADVTARRRQPAPPPMMRRLTIGQESVIGRRQRGPDAGRKVGRALRRLRSLVDQRLPPQFVERQRRVDAPRIIQVAVDQPVEQVP